VPTDDVDRDLEAVSQWWKRLAPQAPQGVVGLWFGITDLAAKNGVSRHLYVAGCPTFDAGDETAEWATDYCWRPEDRYVQAPALAGLPASDFAEVLDHAVTLLERLRPQDAVPVQGVAVGFDDGDFRVTWPS